MMNKFIKRLIRWVENWLDYQAQRVVTTKKWADWNHMKVKKSKGKVLRLGRNQTMQSHMLGSHCLGSRSTAKDGCF